MIQIVSMSVCASVTCWRPQYIIKLNEMSILMQSLLAMFNLRIKEPMSKETYPSCFHDILWAILIPLLVSSHLIEPDHGQSINVSKICLSCGPVPLLVCDCMETPMSPVIGFQKTKCALPLQKHGNKMLTEARVGTAV